ncbi:MAG: enoyl-CoA hydratase/isomerase family protein [Deltaproteobacteria bacterium]|nr:enoyl-CoA hydratase/isomerase family protein [Deltaproteobacteria bacterium]
MNTILFTKNKKIATITLNLPQQLNAMNHHMAADFKATIRKIKKDACVRVVIITGAGRAFSSGGNLDMLASRFKKRLSQNTVELKKFYNDFFSIRDLPQPVIAAINGPAVGAGLCLALACDLRYAGAEAMFCINFARMGLAPGMGTTSLLTRLMGPTQAAEALFRAQTMTAQEAHTKGLVNNVFKQTQLMNKVEKIAQEIASHSPLALQYIKQGLYKSQQKSLHHMFAFDALAQAQCFISNDIKEGIKAIRENRRPVFA